MIDKVTAKRLAKEYLNRDNETEDDRFVILDNATIEKSYGWIFFYNSQRFIETGDFAYALAGNGPLVVSKYDGSLRQLGTAQGTEQTIAEYEQELAA